MKKIFLIFTLLFAAFSFSQEITPKSIEAVAEVGGTIPSGGFTFHSFYRGVLGIISLLFIAYLFSSNRKAIKWKTIIIGLTFQLLIAVGVLTVPFIQRIFESVGQLFVNVLDYTRAGSEFLFGGLMDSSSYGFIFALQVLPTIIFFSALTSVLFYFGILYLKIIKLFVTNYNF